MITRKFKLKESISRRLVGWVTLSLALLLGVGCNRELAPTDEQGLDLSKRTEVTLESVAVASATTRAAGDTPMAVGSQFRMYVMAKGSQNIIETRTYTIATQEGVPTMDAGQPTLKLPYGQLDVYLVGPLNHTIPEYSYDDGGTLVTVPAQTVPIALEDKVTPQHGVDLISSHTAIEVVSTKGNSIVANPLQHKMSQIDIVIERYKSDLGIAVYENMDMEYISIDNVALAGDFVFDANGGTITTASSSSTLTFLGDQIKVTSDAGQMNSFRVTQYVMPRPAKKSKIETKFSYNLVGELPGVAPKARVFSGITSASPLAEGVHIEFYSMPVMGIDLVFRANLLEWDDGSSVVLDPARSPELAVWYSGEDAPEDIYGDGKMYWRDRSGNGNHALITSGLYDAAGKFYYPSPGSAESFVVPPLWNDKNTDYTVELAAQTISASTSTSQYTGFHALNFSNKDIDGGAPTASTIKVDLPYGTTQFRSGGSEAQIFYFAGGSPNNPADKGLHEQFHTFAFARTAGKGYTFVNGKLHQTHTMAYDWLAFNGSNSRLWTPTAVVEPHNKKMRLYGVKIYRSCKKTDNSTEVFGMANAELTTNYTTYLSRLAKSNIAADDYVQDGLILDLRGADITAATTWIDRSISKNNFTFQGTAAASPSISAVFTGSGWLKASKALGKHTEFTIEAVAMANATTRNQCLIQLNSSDVTHGNGRVALYYPYLNSLLIEAPYPGRITVPLANLANGTVTDKSSVCMLKKNNEVFFWQNGSFPSSFVPLKVPDEPLEWNFCMIGAEMTGNTTFAGQIYAVRVYNRPLTEIERQHNYLLDKKTYNLLSNNP